MFYGRSDFLAWCNATLLETRRNNFVSGSESSWSSSKNPYQTQETTSFEKNASCHEPQSEPMVKERLFFQGSDATGEHGQVFNSDDRFGTPVQNAKSAKKRNQTPKNCSQSSKPATSPVSSSQDSGQQDNVSKGPTFRPSTCTSEQRIQGRRHKNHKPRNIARRNSPQNNKKLKQRSSSSEEPDIIEYVRVVLHRIPFRAIWTFLVDSVLWAFGIIVGLSWLLLTYIWECILSLHASATKWYVEFRVWLVKKFPFLRRPKRDHRFSLPKTGEEAVQRLLKCKDSDPYTILGVLPTASDDDIRKSYRSQAVLVHPDKNHSPKAEEAFKILANAFETLGNEEKRAEFDSTFKESVSTDLLETLKKKIEESQNMMGCQSCHGTHNRYPTSRSPFQARYCASCKAMHPAKEGDLWAETSMLGFRWHFYSYLDSAVYDVTEWVRCQKDLLGCMEANTHKAPCRLNIPRGNSFILSRLLDELFGQK